MVCVDGYTDANNYNTYQAEHLRAVHFIIYKFYFIFFIIHQRGSHCVPLVTIRKHSREGKMSPHDSNETYKA